ncbi:MAG: maleylpyruvate isomerase family mycothiol-dependent enzyme [Acidimicrobiales bacterium]
MSVPATAPGILAGNSAEALRAQLDEVWASLSVLGATISDDEWNLPTPCPGWDVAAQYAHMIGTESSLLGRPGPEAPAPAPPHVRNQIGGLNEAWVASLASARRSEVLERFAEVTAARREALSSMSEEDFSRSSWTPVGEADYRRFMQIRVFDCWVHEQDIRDALGRPGHVTGPAVEQSIDEIVRAAGYVVGKLGQAPTGSTVSFELTGPARRAVQVSVADGRARVVDELESSPTTTIRLGSDAYARLSCGRIAASTVVEDGALGGVELAGDVDLGRRIVEHLAFTI